MEICVELGEGLGRPGEVGGVLVRVLLRRHDVSILSYPLAEEMLSGSPRHCG